MRGLRLGLGLGGRAGGGASAPSVPDFWVDSVGGSDSNAGTESAPFQTLSKAVTEINSFGNGCHVRFKGNSVWRESFDPTPNNLIVDWDGTGTPPVISGFDVQTTWVDDTATVAGRWYKDVTHDSSGTNRQMVLEDGALMTRVASAAAVTTAGQYFSADCGSANPIRVYINVGAENPNSSGKVYEVTTRQTAIELQDGCTLTGVVARGAISNNGPLIVGSGSTVSRCVAAYGTKHNYLIEDGLMEDCVAYGNDAPSVSEPGSTIGVAFANDASTFSVTLRRVLHKTTAICTSSFYAHTINDPTDSYISVLLEQCAADIGFGGIFCDAAANAVEVRNSAAFGASVEGFLRPFGIVSATATRSISKLSVDAPAAINQSSGGTMTVSQFGVSRTIDTGAKPVLGLISGNSLTATNVSVDTPSGWFGNAAGWDSGTTGSLTLNNSILVANNAMTIASSGTYSGDENAFGTRNIGPFATWTTGSFYNLTTNIADWRTASGEDSASAGAASAYFTGTTANGDFRQSGALSGSGVTEHWDFNTRAVVSSPPERFPTIPQTYAEAITYITDPTAWDFYP